MQRLTDNSRLRMHGLNYHASIRHLRVDGSLAWQAYPHLFSMRPLWFITMLLIFDFGYDLWRMLTKNRTSYSIGKSSLPSDLLVGVFILALAMATLPDHSQMYSFTEQPAIEG